MTTNTETEFIVTDCLHHGVKVTTDETSAYVYTLAARACRVEFLSNPAHAADHAHEGTDCWCCCVSMVIDPDRHFA